MLKDKRKELVEYVRDNRQYLANNYEIYDIFRGNLLPYVNDILSKTLSKNYYDRIKERIIPINILERYIKKVSLAYANAPSRIANSETSQGVVDFYVRKFEMNKKGMIADQYSHLFNGYAFEPYVDVEPKLRVLPFDRFLAYSDNEVDPTSETIFIKLIGKKMNNNRMQEIYYTFTNDEVDAFSEDGETYTSALIENEGVNPYETIPFIYGNRAENELLPIQDTDILAMSKLISVFLSDLSGAIMFQCFSIIYGIDMDMDNAVMAPNALWSFKSDPNSDKKPEIGTIKPEADIDKVMGFVVSVFSMWLQTKGIKVNSIGNISSDNMASGISKIIDEMDAYKVVKESIEFFEVDEREFWLKMVKIHNNWVDTKQVTGQPRLPDDFDIMIEFPAPQPQQNRIELINEKKLEVDSGFKSRRKAIKELNPKMTDEELEMELSEIDGESTVDAPQVVDG